MLIAYPLLFSLFLFCPIFKLSTPLNGIHSDYISAENTLPIKGLFTVIVMFSHFRGYVTLPNTFLNNSFGKITDLIGQLMVACFLFYSGFGIYESLKKRGKDYIKSFPKKRLLTVWLSFAICVCFYLIYNILTHKVYPLSETLLSFTGWTSIGNSNWFMFVYFALCILLPIAYFPAKDVTSKKPLLIFCGLCLLLFAALYRFKEPWWWDTLFCFPAGMVYSYFKKDIDQFVSKTGNYLLALAALIVVFGGSYFVSSRGYHIFYPVAACTLCLIIVALSMKIKIRSLPLKFMGKHVFSVYILQRLVYSVAGAYIKNVYLFFIVSIIATIAVAVLFDLLFGKLKNQIVKN